MALVNCKECGHPVSTEAKSCPNCGAKAPKRSGTGLAPLLVIGLIAYAVYATSSSPNTEKKPPSAAELQKEKDFQTVVAGARWLKRNLKNPSSFELVSAVMVGSDAICYVYRGTNSFNAIVTSRHVFTDSANTSDERAWAKHCAGRQGVDFSHARHAL